MKKLLTWILRILAIVAGIVLILGGVAGSIWTVWDLIKDFFGESVIGNLQIMPGVKILLLPHLFVLGVFAWIAIAGGKLFNFGRGAVVE